MARKASVGSATSESNISDDSNKCDLSASSPPDMDSKAKLARALVDHDEQKSPATTKGKSNYKHIPHSQKPPHLVQKRNARERRRVTAVNDAFHKLRRSVPIENRNKRVSKVKTLQRAIDYIRKLEDILAEDDAQDNAQAGELGANIQLAAICKASSATTSGQQAKCSAQSAKGCDLKRSSTKVSKSAAAGGFPKARNTKTPLSVVGGGGSGAANNNSKLADSPAGSLYSNSPRSDRVNMASSSSTSSVSLSSGGWYPAHQPDAGEIAGSFAGYHQHNHQQQSIQSYHAHNYGLGQQAQRTNTYMGGYPAIHKGLEQSNQGQQYYGHEQHHAYQHPAATTSCQPVGMEAASLHALPSSSALQHSSASQVQDGGYYPMAANSYAGEASECITSLSSNVMFDQHKSLAPLVNCASPALASSSSGSSVGPSSVSQSHSSSLQVAGFAIPKTADVQRQRQQGQQRQQQLSADADSTTASYPASKSSSVALTVATAGKQQLANRDNTAGGSISSALVGSSVGGCNDDYYTYPGVVGGQHLSMASSVHNQSESADIHAVAAAAAGSSPVYQQLDFEQAPLDGRASSKAAPEDNGKGELGLDVQMQTGAISSTFDGFRHHQPQDNYQQQQGYAGHHNHNQNHLQHHHQQQQQQHHHHHHHHHHMQQQHHHHRQQASQSANINGLADSTTTTTTKSGVSTSASATATSTQSQLMIHHHGGATAMHEIGPYSQHHVQVQFQYQAGSSYQGERSAAMLVPPQPAAPTHHHVQMQAIQEYTL